MRVLVAALAVCLMAGVVQAATLAEWTFEVSIPANAGPHAAEGGIFGGDAYGWHEDESVVYSNPVGNGSLESFSSNYWSVGDYYEFQTSSLGYTGVEIQFDQTRSGTGPATFDLLISTDGDNWITLVDDYTVDQVTWSSAIYKDESTFGPYDASALDNQATIYVRMVSEVTTATAGTNRIDNVIITGVPEPATLVLLGLGGLFCVSRRRS